MAPNSNQRRGGNKGSTHRSDRHSMRKDHKRYFGCGICQADHRLVDCKKFDRLNLAERYKTVVKLHYCVNCLARNHLIDKCGSKSRCQKCQGKHHTVLHGPNKILKDIAPNEAPSTSKRATAPTPAPRRSLLPATITTSLAITNTTTKTVVPTVVVQVVMDPEGQDARAVLNPSLTQSRIAASFVRESWLHPFKVEEEVYVKVLIAPKFASTVRYDVCMLVVNDLPKNPYPNAMDKSISSKVYRISLADPEFFSNEPVVMEIGGDLYTTILQPNVIHIDGGSLVAQDSTLGWLVMGSLKN